MPFGLLNGHWTTFAHSDATGTGPRVSIRRTAAFLPMVAPVQIPSVGKVQQNTEPTYLTAAGCKHTALEKRAITAQFSSLKLPVFRP